MKSLNIPEVKLGIVAVSRDCFPIELSRKRREAAAAECDVLAAQRDDLYRVPGGARPVGEGVCQRLGVAAGAQACAEDENVLGHIGLLLFERLDTAAVI